MACWEREILTTGKEGKPGGAVGIQHLHLEASLAPSLNLAFFQNAFPFIQELVVVNGSDQTLTDIELYIGSDPPFVREKTWRLEAVGAGQSHHLRDLDVSLDGALLGRLTEAETGTVRLELRAAGIEPVLVAVDVELLARNQWGGIGHVPEMVAAFVQPNDPAVDRLLKKVAEVLRQNGRNPGLDGYGGDARRAWELTSAIWTACGALGLDYALPPASFE